MVRINISTVCKDFSDFGNHLPAGAGFYAATIKIFVTDMGITVESEENR
jgi:hypothetical protein